MIDASLVLWQAAPGSPFEALDPFEQRARRVVYGRVRQTIPRHKVDALAAHFGFRDHITFYTAHGDVFAWLCAIVSMAGAGFALMKIGPGSAQ